MTLTRRQLLAGAGTLGAMAAGGAFERGLLAAAAQPRDAREQWNRIYGATDFPFKTERNEFLAEVIKGRTAGTALDIGVGRGRNSLYLASQGWTVTGVDISDEGVRIATAEAARAGLQITAMVQDFATFDIGTGRWDLIAGLYMGDLIVTHAKRIMAALRPGGLLVVENFGLDLNRPAMVGGAPLGYGVNQLLTVFADLRVRRYEDTLGVADWARGAQPVPVVRLAAEKR
ncbi:MAG: class I SAM-dependent methyltransferase [Vicinamibacterales bacterium]